MARKKLEPVAHPDSLLTAEELIKKMNEGYNLRVCTENELNLLMEFAKEHSNSSNDFFYNFGDFEKTGTPYINAMRNLNRALSQKRYRFIEIDNMGYVYSASRYSKFIYASDIMPLLTKNQKDTIKDIDRLLMLLELHELKESMKETCGDTTKS